MRIIKFVKRLHLEEEAVTTVEYAVLIVAILLICVKTIQVMGVEAQQAFQTSADAMDGVV